MMSWYSGPGSTFGTPKVDARKVNDSLYELWKPSGTPKMELLFFHGLQFGDLSDVHLRTWESQDGSFLWPQKWLVEEFPMARILCVSYDGGVRKSLGSSFDMHIIVENLISDFMQGKIGQTPNCPVVLIGHCFGGLMIEKLCLEANKLKHVGLESERPKLYTFLDNVKGMFFYGVPHHGTRGLSKAAKLLKSPLLSYFETLGKDASRLGFEFNQLRRVYPAWQIWGLGENLPGDRGIFDGIVAAPEAGARNGDNCNLLPVEHMSICKPPDKADKRFYFLTQLLDIIARNSEVVARPIHECYGLPKYAIGLARHALDVRVKLLDAATLGICGMGGIGKTTLAKHTFNSISKDFEYTCFVDNVKGIPGHELEEQVLNHFHHDGCKSDKGSTQWSHLKNKKTLIAMDDIDSEDQLNVLPKLQYFGTGSRVIMTSRHQEVFKFYDECVVVYEVDFLKMDDAKKLFCEHAFGSEVIPETLIDIVNAVVKKCAGLPLTLEVIGNYLHGSGTDLNVWRETLKRLGKAQVINGDKNDRLWASLRVSYDSLSEEEQEMFLEAATIFFEQPLDRALASWSTRNDNMHTAWRNLVSKSLVKEVSRIDFVHSRGLYMDLDLHNEYKEIWVHEQLQDLAKKIAGINVSEVDETTNLIVDGLNDKKKIANDIMESGADETTNSLVDGLNDLKGTELHNMADAIIYELKHHVATYTRQWDTVKDAVHSTSISMRDASIRKRIQAVPLSVEEIVAVLAFSRYLIGSPGNHLRNSSDGIHDEFDDIEHVTVSTGLQFSSLSSTLNANNDKQYDWKLQGCDDARKMLIRLISEGKLDDHRMACLLQLPQMTSKACKALIQILPIITKPDFHEQYITFSSVYGETMDTLLALLDNDTSTRRRIDIINVLLYVLEYESADSICSVAKKWSELLAEESNSRLQIAIMDALQLRNPCPSGIIIMGELSGILEVILGLMVSGKDYNVRMSAGKTISWFCNWRNTALRIADIPNAVETLFILFLSKETLQEIRSIAGSILGGLISGLDDGTKLRAIQAGLECMGGCRGLEDILANTGDPTPGNLVEKNDCAEKERSEMVEEFMTEVKNGDGDGYFVSKTWMLGLDKHEKEALMSVLGRAGYLEIYQTDTTMFYERVDDGLQAPTMCNDPSGTPESNDFRCGDMNKEAVSNDSDFAVKIEQNAFIAEQHTRRMLTSDPNVRNFSFQDGIQSIPVQSDQTTCMNSPKSLPDKGKTPLTADPSKDMLESFKTAMKDSSTDNYSVSTQWISTLSDHEREDLSFVVSKAGYSQIYQTSTATYYERLQGHVHNPTDRNENSSTFQKKNIVGGAESSKTFQRTGNFSNDDLHGSNIDDNNSSAVTSTIQESQKRDVKCPCHPQLLTVSCTPGPSTSSLHGENDSKFSTRRAVGDSYIILPKKREGQFMRTGVDKSISMSTVSFPATSDFKDVSLKVSAYTTFTCCLKSDHSPQKVCIEFSTIEGEVKMEEDENPKTNTAVLRSMRVNVDACIKHSEESEEPEPISLYIQKSDSQRQWHRVLQTCELFGDYGQSRWDDLLWMVVSANYPKGAERGSSSNLELQCHVKNRIDNDSRRCCHDALGLHFKDSTHPVVFEGVIHRDLEAGMLLEFNVRYQLVISYNKPDRLIAGNNAAVTKRVDMHVDFDCVLEFRTRGFPSSWFSSLQRYILRR